MKAWIISLNPKKAEAVELKHLLKCKKVEAEIIPAVDGRKAMPALTQDEAIDQNKALINRKAPLTSSEIGCYLSHLRAIKKAYQEGLNHIAIFEDDVIAEENLAELLDAIETLDDDAHLVRLMSLKRRERKELKQLTPEYKLTRPLRGALGTQGYVLNREGMKRILNFGSTITMPIDKLYDSFFLFGLKCYSVEPHAIYEKAHPSTIKKTQGQLDSSLSTIILWRLNKLFRSIKRHTHRIKHRTEFSPASKPPKKFGKSQRIR